MPSRYVFCAVDTGELVGTMAADHDLGAVHVPAGQVAFASSDATAATHCARAAALVAYTPAQAAAKAARPGYPARWSNATCTWQDLRTFESGRDSAAESVMQRMAIAEASQLRPTRDYLAMTLIVLPTPAQMAARNAEASRLSAAYTGMERLRTKLAAINAATTHAQLDAATALPSA